MREGQVPKQAVSDLEELLEAWGLARYGVDS